MKYKKVEQKNTLKPLQQWFCDNCNEVIKSPENGCLEWIIESSLELKTVEASGFKIIHDLDSSPIKTFIEERVGCYGYQNAKLTACRVSLAWLIGFQDDKRLLHVLRNPSHRPKDVSEFVEIMRRLELPYYEEARLYLDLAKGDNQFNQYSDLDLLEPNVLKAIIQKYSGYRDWFTAEEIRDILRSLE